MNRPKRDIKPTKRLIEDDEPQQKKTPQPKRTLNLKIDKNPPVNVNDIVKNTISPKPKRQPKRVINMTLNDNPPVNVDDIVKNTQLPKPKRQPREPKRTLDLTALPKSSDDKTSKDYGLFSHAFWKNHFYVPNDNISKIYQKAVEKLQDILPANFQLYKDLQDEAFGVANLELKEEFKKPMKRIPLMSKLEKGDYHTDGSKSDKNIASTIKFFRNNLPSFTKYKNEDDISWVINYHRLLVAEIFQYYANSPKLPSTATIKSRFNAITRIFRIAYETKNYALYEKYSSVVMFLGDIFEDDEFRNELNEYELKKFITFDVVLDKQKELEKQFELIKDKKTTTAYDLNQDLLLVSLYSLIPPLRNEVKTLKFSKHYHDREDWIVIDSDGDVMMTLNEEKKRHDAIKFNITEESPELAKILKESFELYPRVPVFTTYNKYPDVSTQAKSQALSDRITSIFSFTGKSVSVNTFRSSYVSWVNSEAIKRGRQLSVRDKEKIAYRMRTSRKYLDEAYLKLFPIEQKEAQEPQQKVINVVPVQEPQNNAYATQLQRNKKYYENNKQKVLDKQKEYKDSRPAHDKTRVRILYNLNHDPNYYSRMKDATKDKYQFKQENGRWV